MARSSLLVAALLCPVVLAGCAASLPAVPVVPIASAPSRQPPEHQPPERPLCELSFQANSVQLRRDVADSPFAMFSWARVEGALSPRMTFEGVAKGEGVAIEFVQGPDDLRTREATQVSPVLTLEPNQSVVVEARGSGHIMRPSDDAFRAGRLVFASLEELGAPLDCSVIGFGERVANRGAPPEGSEAVVLRVDGAVEVAASPGGPPGLRITSETEANWVFPIVVNLISRGADQSRVHVTVDALTLEGYVDNAVLGETAERQRVWMCGTRPYTPPATESCHVASEVALWWAHDGNAEQIGTIDPTADFGRTETVGDLLTIRLRESWLMLHRGALAISPGVSFECGPVEPDHDV